MVKNWLFILFLLTFRGLLIAQDKEADFEQLVDKAVKKMYQNPGDCINFAQSLSISNQNAEHRMILQNVMAQAQVMKGDYMQSVKLSLEEDNTEASIPVSSFAALFLNYNLAEQYQNLRLYRQSAKIIRNSLQNIHEKSLYATPKGSITIAKLYQLSAINMAITKDYSKALKTFGTSDTFLKSGNNENHIIRTENELYRVGILYNQGKLPEAKKIWQRSSHRCQAPTFFFCTLWLMKSMPGFVLQKAFIASLCSIWTPPLHVSVARDISLLKTGYTNLMPAVILR